MPYQNYYQQYPQLNQFQQPQHQEIVRVNGRAGAEMYQLAPNSSVLMLDETAPIVWAKSTDGAGYPTLTPYTISQYEQEKPVDIHALEERITKIEEALSAKSNTGKAVPKQDNATKPRHN